MEKIATSTIVNLKKFGLFKSNNINSENSNNESIFSTKNKIFGGIMAASSLTNLALFPMKNSKTLTAIKGLNSLLMAFCGIALVSDIIKNIINKNKSDQNSPSDTKTNNNQPQNNPNYQKEPHKPLRIAILDDFIHPDKTCGNLTHGEIVENLIKSEFPDAIIERKDVTKTSSFTKLAQDINDGVHYDAINMSGSTDAIVKLDNLEIVDKSGQKIKITNDNIKQYTTDLRDLLLKKEKENNPNIETILKSIEIITDHHIPLFQSNNNDVNNKIALSDVWDFNPKYPNHNNPYLITVSSTENNKRYTTLSDKHESAYIKLTKCNGGIDYTGDNIADITDTKLVNALKTLSTLEGNSYATPMALIKHFRQK